MPEARDVQALIGEAEKAASAGDYVAAEAFLRDAADEQEATLGPLHPDLANTLNNLAVVCETINRPGDAERCYRRAYAIAITSLEPDHPFVATSEKNYRDFCAARGIAYIPPKAVPKVEPDPVPPPVQIPEPVTEPEPVTPFVAVSPPATPQLPPPAPVTRTSRPPVMAVAGVLGLVALISAGVWLSSNRGVESPESVETSQNSSTPESVAQSLEKPAPAPESIALTEGRAPSKLDGPVATTTSLPRARGETERGRATASTPTKLTVDDAELCSQFSTKDWRCRRAGSPVDSGRVFFYTRIKSPEPMVVEHRWYRGDSLHRVVAVRIQANERSGFRSFSGTAVKQGNWRVELRTRDGAVLHEEKFVVR